MIFRHSDNEFLMTAARPNLGYLESTQVAASRSVRGRHVEYGMLAIQGPRSREVLSQLTGDVDDLKFFELTQTKIGSAPVTLSRTGYTGDLGYELSVPSRRGRQRAGRRARGRCRARGIRPFGEEALNMLRIEAGLPLVDIDFHNSRLVTIDADRVTPKELGMGWMLRGLDGDRPFIGRAAIRRELAEQHVALGERRPGRRLGALEPALPRRRPASHQGRAPAPLRVDAVRRRPRRGRLRTSFMYSPVLQRHIGMARVRPSLAKPGSRVHVEIDHQPPQHDGAGADRPDAASSTPSERRPDPMTTQVTTQPTSTTPSSSAAATTASSTAPTSPRPASAR